MVIYMNIFLPLLPIYKNIGFTRVFTPFKGTMNPSESFIPWKVIMIALPIGFFWHVSFDDRRIVKEVK